jgi:hypothetical protein
MAALHVLVFLFLLATCGSRGYCNPITSTFLAVFSSQGFLLGLWAALGGKPTPWRATAVVIVAAIWGWCLGDWGWEMGTPHITPTGIATAVLIGQTFQVTGILLIARLFGLGLKRAELGDEDRLGHLQFSVRDALSWMTAITVFMAATHYLKDACFVYFRASDMHLSVSSLAVAMATMWLILGNGWVTVRSLMLLLVIGIGATWTNDANRLFGNTYLLLCEAALTAASLAVVRLAGYRLVRHWPFRRPGKSSSNVGFGCD